MVLVCNDMDVSITWGLDQEPVTIGDRMATKVNFYVHTRAKNINIYIFFLKPHIYVSHVQL